MVAPHMKLNANQLVNGANRAVSPVVGVILMVAITVILAAVIGAFVLDLGSSQQQNAIAGVDVTQKSAGGATHLIITAISMDGADRVSIQTGGSEVGNLTAVGGSVNITSVTAGTDYTIIAELNGKENVIQTYTVR